MEDLKTLNDSIKQAKKHLKILREVGVQETDSVTKMLEVYVEKINSKLNEIEQRVSMMEEEEKSRKAPERSPLRRADLE